MKWKHSTFSKHEARHSHRKRAEKTLPGCGRLAHTLVPKDSAVAAWNPFSFNDFRETIHAAHSEFIRLPFLSEWFRESVRFQRDDGLRFGIEMTSWGLVQFWKLISLAGKLGAPLLERLLFLAAFSAPFLDLLIRAQKYLGGNYAAVRRRALHSYYFPEKP